MVIILEKLLLEGGNNDQLTPSLVLYEGGDNNIGGTEFFGAVNIDLLNEEGNLRTPSDIAQTTVHELLHTVRLAHPFERTQSLDTELVHVSGNNYKSTAQTDANILYNIMNYSMIRVDGKTANGNQTLLTKGQINLMVKEIGLQKQGYGMIPKYNSAVSKEVNDVEYYKKYLNYWKELPGKDVPKAK